MVTRKWGRRAHARIARDEQNVIPFVKLALNKLVEEDEWSEECEEKYGSA